MMKNNLFTNNLCWRSARIVAILLCFVIGASCAKEELPQTADDGYAYLNVEINTYSEASEDSQALGAAEYNIRRVRFYVTYGGKVGDMIYHDNIPANSGTYSISLKVKRADIKLLAIVNEPDTPEMHKQLAAIKTTLEMDRIKYDIADYLSSVARNSEATFTADDFCLPCCSYNLFSTINSTSQQDNPEKHTIRLDRMVARVDVMLQKRADVQPSVKITSATTLSIKNTSDSGKLADRVMPYAGSAPVNIPNAAKGPATALEVPIRNASDNSKAVRAFSFYTPWFRVIEPLGFSLKGVDFGGRSYDFDVTINNELTYYLYNKVYKVYCTFTPKKTDITTNIVEWTDVAVEGGVLGTELTFSQSRIYMDALKLGGFTATLNVASTKENISSVVEYVYGYTSTTNGSNLPAWLPKSSISGLPDGTSKTAAIRMTYYPDTATSHTPVKLVFQSGLTRNTVEIWYANSATLTYAQLRAAGWSEAPTRGITVSMSGCVPPGYGATADFQDTWSNAGYCNDLLSVSNPWYMPDKEAMVAIMKCNGCLSLPYQFLPDAKYWCEAYDNATSMAWSVTLNSNFTTVLEDAKTKNYVRCVQNIK